MTKNPEPSTAPVAAQVWTDGACSGNPGPGGWGSVIRAAGAKTREISGGENMTTNNRMELLAAIRALEELQARHGRCCVTMHTDSTYVKDGITKWIKGWKSNGWRNAAKKPVKNRDLWQKLDAARNQHDIVWRWIKAHDGNVGNERADLLARRAVVGKRGSSGQTEQGS